MPGTPSDRYALLLVALEQTIEREDLESASSTAPALPLADCARIARDSRGVLVGHLPLDQARALHRALAALGHPTDLVPQSALVAPPPPARLRAVALVGNTLFITDAQGRAERFARDDVVVAAVGLVAARISRAAATVESDRDSIDAARWRPDSPAPAASPRRLYVEFVLRAGLRRLRGVVANEETLEVDGVRVEAADLAPVQGFTERLRAWLPTHKVNRGVRHGWESDPAVYPGDVAFIEEIVWLLHRFRTDGAA